MKKLRLTKRSFFKEREMYKSLQKIHDKILNTFKKSNTFKYVYDGYFFNDVNLKRSAIVTDFHLFFNLLFVLFLVIYIKNWANNWGVDFSLLSGMDSASIIYMFMDSAVVLVFFAPYLTFSRLWVAIAFIVSLNSLIHLSGLYKVFESSFIPHDFKQNIYLIKWLLIFLLTPAFMKLFYPFTK